MKVLISIIFFSLPIIVFSQSLKLIRKSKVNYIKPNDVITIITKTGDIDTIKNEYYGELKTVSNDSLIIQIHYAVDNYQNGKRIGFKRIDSNISINLNHISKILFARPILMKSTLIIAWLSADGLILSPLISTIANNGKFSANLFLKIAGTSIGVGGLAALIQSFWGDRKYIISSDSKKNIWGLEYSKN